MKTLVQLVLLLSLIVSAEAQESQSPEPTKTLQVFDWNDLAQRPALPAGEVISMDGMSVLKIEETNAVPVGNSSYPQDKPVVISLLKITNSVVKETHWVSCEIKYEDVWSGFVEHTNIYNHLNNAIYQEYGHLSLLTHYPPSVSGGDERVKSDHFDLDGTSNWRLCKLVVVPAGSGDLPTRLEIKLSIPSTGTIYLRPIKFLGSGVPGNWWQASQSGMVGGAVGIFGGVIGCFGGLLGCLAGFGKARKFVLATTKIFIALGMCLTITGIVAILCRQPYSVWYVFLLPGVILTLVFSLNFPMIQRRYDDLEIRRMASLDV
jgi:hypothetical protein